MISHHNVIAQCLQVHQITPPEHKRVLAVLPLFHSESPLVALFLTVFLVRRLHCLLWLTGP